ncbi:MAG: hypothetical protein SVO26_02005 [Chloroflexota bacterium]|nr:hypothetical protein [Chloroflexota bacterium]
MCRVFSGIFGCSVRLILALVLMAALVATMVPGIALAESPPGCNGNTFNIMLQKDKSVVQQGDIIEYTVNAFNFPGGCDVEDVTLTFYPPGPDGTPSGAPCVLDTGVDFPAGGAGVLYLPGAYPCLNYTVDVNPGVAQVVAMVDYEGTLMTEPTGDASGNKTVTSTVVWGELTVFKYNDLDRSSTYDAGNDTGLDDWHFSVTGPLGYTASGDTSGGGYITLTNLVPGFYTVEETPQVGWVNSDPGIDPPTPIVKTVEVVAGQRGMVMFGNYVYVGSGDLVVFKYNDTGGDGGYDPGDDTGLDGWDFTIVGPSGSFSETTYSGGYIYLFGLEVGQYTVTETPQDGWINTDPGITPPTPIVKTVEVTEEGPSTVRFGNYLEVASGGLTVFKYRDTDGNGVYDAADDPGLNGWEFTIDGPSGTFSEVTASGGYAQFTGLDAGQYTVTETLKPGWRNTDPGVTPIVKTVQVLDDETALVRFGNIYSPPSVPTVGQWGIVAMITMFVVSLVWMVRRKQFGTEQVS